MGYRFDLNNRLIDSLIDSCSKVSRPLSINGQELIKKTVAKEMTSLDKFYVFINPTQALAQFKWSDRDVARATLGNHGQAKDLIEMNLDLIQKKMNQEIISESQNCFNSIEAILDFAHDNEGLLDLLSRDTGFYLRFLEKLDQWIKVADTREKTLTVTDRFFSKLSNAVQIQGWKTQGERAREIKSEIDNKLSGKLSVKEVRDLFKRKDPLKLYEERRIYINLRDITHHNIDEGEKEIGLENFLEKGVKSPIILELEKYYQAMWQGIYEGGDFENSLNIVPADRKFDELYQAIYHHFKDNVELRDICFKAIFENTGGKEIEQFLELFNKMMYNRHHIPSDELLVERQMLRAIPVKKYLLYQTEQLRGKVGSSRQEAMMAALLFVESIKAKDIAGIAYAKGIIKHYIRIENMRASIRTISIAKLKKAVFDHVDENVPDDKGEKKFSKHVREFLTPEELALFTDSYGSLYPVEDEKHVDEVVQEHVSESASSSSETLTDEQLDELMQDQGSWEPPNQKTDLEKELELRMSLLEAPHAPKDKLVKPKKAKTPKIENT